MRWNLSWVGWTICLRCSVIAWCTPAAAQVNAWLNPSSGPWEVATNWSLGATPGPGQSVMITNAGWKAVAIGPDAANNLPESLNVQSITVSAPSNSFNVLLLNYAGNTPVQAYTVTIQSNAALAVLDSTLLVTNTGNSGYRIEVGGTINHGANATVATSFLSLGNIGPGTYYMTNGTLTGTIEYFGGSYTGRFEQFGGSNYAGLLRVQGAGYEERGRYELHDGSLGGTIQPYGGGIFRQSGGFCDANLQMDGTYVLDGGLYTNASLALPDAIGDFGAVTQSGGTNRLGTLSIGNAYYASYFSDGAYTLSNGVLQASTVNIELSPFTQSGGTFSVQGAITLRGYELSVKPYGEYFYGQLMLYGGCATADSLELQDLARVYQSGGTNTIANNLDVGNDSAENDSYDLAGGTLISSNVTVHGFGSTYFANLGGLQTVKGVLRVTGWLAPGNGTNYYVLNGGRLGARAIELENALFIHQSGALLNSPSVILSNGTWQAAIGETQLGTLQGNGTIVLPAGFCLLSFSNSTALPLGPLVIQGWNGSLAGDGQHQISFGPNGLTSEQLSQIQFQSPNAIPGSYPARLMPSGELVPAQILQARRTAGNLVLQWALGGILQAGTNVTGPYTDLTNMASPYTNTFSEPQRFFRLKQPTTFIPQTPALSERAGTD